MALTASSALHYFDSKYGTRAIYGGDEHHSRASAGAAIMPNGRLYDAIVHTPRFTPVTVDGKSRQALLLEMARTNNVTYSNDFANAAWTKTNCTVTPGMLDPLGGTGASRITATGVDAELTRQLANAASLKRANSLWIRRATGTGDIRMWNPGAAALPVQAVTPTWQRFSPVDAAASVERWMLLQIRTSGDAVDIYNFQMDDSAFPTSDVVTPAATLATRAADSFYWDFIHAPQGMMVYVRFVESGTIADSVSGGKVLHIGKADGTFPGFTIYNPGTVYRTFFHDGASNVLSTLAAAPVVGDVVELLAILYPTGSVELVQSINGAAVTSAAASSTLTLTATWSDTRLWLNSVGATAIGANKFLDARLVKYADVVGATAQARLDELREFQFDSVGNLI